MVVLSALPRTRDTDKESVAATDHRSITRPSNRQGGRWSLRNLGLLGGIGPREHQSPHQQAEVLVVVDLPASHKQSTESNSSLETAATAATSSSSSSSAWASNTIQYEPSADDVRSSSEHSSNMRRRPSTGKGASSPSAGRPPSDDINGIRRPSIASDVIRAIAETASSVGIASSTATAAATEHKAKFTDDNSRSTTRASPQTMARRPPPSTAKEPTANVPRPVSSDNGKNVIHAQIRRRYSNPTLPDMLASSSHSSSGTGSTATSGGGNDTNANTFATSSSRPMPGRKASRRSSLKKVSSYGPAAEQQHRRASLRNFTGRRRMTPPLSSTTTTMGGGGGLSGRRRHSMVDMTTAAALGTNSNDGDGTGSSVRDDRQSRRRSISLPTMYKEVTFDSSVSYATIPYVHDLCPRAPQRLFYADEDYARMKGDLCSDAKQIKKENKKKQQEQELKQKQTYSEPRNIKTSSFLPTKGGDEKYYGNNAEPKAPATDDPAEGVDVDDNLCNWGIEHHTCSRAERHERAERARSVINAVLWKQSTIRQSAQSDPVVHADTITTKLARTSIKASQVARIQAVERATKVEFHCSRIIDRRHSEGNAKYGARILDGLSDSEDEGEGGTMGAGKVEDKTLDETVGKRRLPGYRRRASLA